MTIKPYLYSLFILSFSFHTFAASATQQQIDQLIKIEHWDQFKPALLKQSMPNMKSATEELMFDQLQYKQALSAEQQALIIQISDIMINDMIEQVDEKVFLTNIRTAYQTLSQEQAQALINVYQQPNMQNAGQNVPIMIAKIVDTSSNDFNKIINLEDIQNIIRENQK